MLRNPQLSNYCGITQRRQDHACIYQVTIRNEGEYEKQCTTTPHYVHQSITDLEVLIKSKVPTIHVLLFFFTLNGLFLVRACHDTSLLVITNALLEEVGLASQ